MEKPGSAPEHQRPDALALSTSGRDLVERARRHHLGLDFLKDGHPESVAVIHGVHPRVVHEVRKWLVGRPGATL